MSLPDFRPSSSDTILIGTQCADTKQTVCYFYKPEQAPAVICLLKADFRSGRICATCSNEMIDKVCITFSEGQDEQY